MIDLTVPKGAFSPDELEVLVKRLTEVVIEWEGGTEAPGYDRAAWAFAHEANLVAVGGRPRRPGGRNVYRVVASVPKGSLDDRRRAGLMRDVSAAVIEAEGAEVLEGELGRVWCIVDEVPDGNWGVGSGPMRLRDLAAMFEVSPGSERWNELRFDQR
ncbi:MAG: tautomerase family protein [Acidimicrobiales bacterium]